MIHVLYTVRHWLFEAPFSGCFLKRRRVLRRLVDCCGVRIRRRGVSAWRSRGYGTVRYSSEEEASSAIATLNGADFEGRVITVRMDKYQN